MKLEITIRNTENIGDLTQENIEQIHDVVQALVASGGLTGVKGGQTILHFDGQGVFQKVELKYFPWERKRKY